jgi:hypothetical protein
MKLLMTYNMNVQSWFLLDNKLFLLLNLPPIPLYIYLILIFFILIPLFLFSKTINKWWHYLSQCLWFLYYWLDFELNNPDNNDNEKKKYILKIMFLCMLVVILAIMCLIYSGIFDILDWLNEVISDKKGDDITIAEIYTDSANSQYEQNDSILKDDSINITNDVQHRHKLSECSFEEFEAIVQHMSKTNNVSWNWEDINNSPIEIKEIYYEVFKEVCKRKGW